VPGGKKVMFSLNIFEERNMVRKAMGKINSIMVYYSHIENRIAANANYPA